MYPDTDARVLEQSGALTFCRRNDIVEAELDFSSLCCGRCVCRAPAGRQRSCPTVRTKPSTSSLIASEGSAAFIAKPMSSGQTSKRSSPISCQDNSTIRSASWHNTLEHWSEDVSKQIADEMQTRCDIEGVAIPEHVIDFVARHTGAIRQLSLRLV